MKNFLHIFVLISFVLAGISPACKFISGQTKQIEICSYDGMKTITVADTQAPADKKNDHKKSDDCGFCFAQSHLKMAKAVPAEFTPVRMAYLNPAIIKLEIYSQSHESAVSPRGPPAFLS